LIQSTILFSARRVEKGNRKKDQASLAENAQPKML